MKTLTEFDGFRLKNALKTKQELLASGKTAEEVAPALGEALKLEGDKLTILIRALEVAESRPENLKRIVVMNAEEGKPAPSGAVQKDNHFYLAEFFYVPPTKNGRGDRPFDKKKGERGKGGKRKGRGGGRDGGRGSDRDRNRGRGGANAGGPTDGAPREALAGPDGAPTGERKPGRRHRPPRPRPTGQPTVLPKPNVVPKTTAPANESVSPSESKGPEIEQKQG